MRDEFFGLCQSGRERESLAYEVQTSFPSLLVFSTIFPLRDERTRIRESEEFDGILIGAKAKENERKRVFQR